MLNEVIPLCTNYLYSLYYIYIFFIQHNYIIKAQVKATCFDLKSHCQAKLRSIKFFTMCLRAFHNCRIRQDATDPKQKSVTDYKEQVDRHPPPNPIHRKTKKQ